MVDNNTASQNITRFEAGNILHCKDMAKCESSLSKSTVKLVVQMKPLFTGKPSQQKEGRSCTAQRAISEDDSN